MPATPATTDPTPPRPARTDPEGAPNGSLLPLVGLLGAVALLIPFDVAWFGLPAWSRLTLGLGCAAGFVLALPRETPERRRIWLALAAPLALLAVVPISTDLRWWRMAVLGIAFALAIAVPAWLLRGTGVLTFRFWPKKLDRVDLGYTLLSIPLAWAGFALYFLVLSPEVPFNWTLPPEPDNLELAKLFVGINAVGIWDELFFVNTCYAAFRALFPARIANPAQTVIYTSVLTDMAFTGWGPLLVAILAVTQGAMYERSKVLLWVLIVHLIVDYFLFQGIVEAYYPGLEVWWHP